MQDFSQGTGKSTFFSVLLIQSLAHWASRDILKQRRQMKLQQ
jgi:hypothetical protein